VSSPITRQSQFANQRRSQRILFAVPVRVSGNLPNGTHFAEHTSTLIVNAHGGLILLKAPVSEGKNLTIRNMRTAEEITCAVVDVNPGVKGIAEVGVEFEGPNPRFWRASFPPADWSPRSPEAKQATSKQITTSAAKPSTAKK